MKILVHDAVIVWPNGKGQTHCTKEFKKLLDTQLSICDPSMGEKIDDLSNSLYQEWHVLQFQMDQMMNGHVGKKVRYV